MADPLSAMQNQDSMQEPQTDDAVQQALHAHTHTRRRRRVPANIAPSNIQPSKLAHYLGEKLLKSALTTDPQTSCQYGPAALAGIQTAKPKGKMCSGNGWGNMQGGAGVTSAPGIAKMAGNEWVDMLRNALSSGGAKALAGFKGLDPTLRSAIGYGGAGLIGGGLAGGVKGMFDEKDDDESRIGHALRTAGKWGGIGGAVGAGGGALASEASRLAPEIAHAGKSLVSGPSALKNLPGELKRMHGAHTKLPRGTGRPGPKIPATDIGPLHIPGMQLPEFSQFGLSRQQGYPSAVGPVDSVVDMLTKSNADKYTALAYPALAGAVKSAMGASPGGPQGAGGPGMAAGLVGGLASGPMGAGAAAPLGAKGSALSGKPPVGKPGGAGVLNAMGGMGGSMAKLQPGLG